MTVLQHCIKHCKIGLYAGDTVHIYATKIASDIKVILRQDLILVYSWLKLNPCKPTSFKCKENLSGISLVLIKTSMRTRYIFKYKW